jgi:NADPH2:quinone reductase
VRAWLLEGLGGLDKLRLGDAPDPAPGEGEVLLRVHYAALNPADYYLAQGEYPARPPFPHILGRDGIGTIESVGPGVTNWKAGDTAVLLRSEIGVNRWGTLAEKCAIPVASLAPAPPGWTEPQAAGAPLVYLTAYQALTQWGQPLPGGSVVLVTGASGGVGVASIQLATAMGHHVIALSRGTSKRDALAQLGAKAIFDPSDPTWRKQLKEHLATSDDARRVDLAIDNVGGEGFNDLLDTLGHAGKVACIGRLAGPVPQFNTAALFFRRIEIKGVFVGDYSPEQAQAAWTETLATLRQTGATPLVDRVFPFDQLPDAFARLKQGPLGKVVLAVGSRA